MYSAYFWDWKKRPTGKYGTAYCPMKANWKVKVWITKLEGERGLLLAIVNEFSSLRTLSHRPHRMPRSTLGFGEQPFAIRSGPKPVASVCTAHHTNWHSQLYEYSDIRIIQICRKWCSTSIGYPYGVQPTGQLAAMPGYSDRKLRSLPLASDDHNWPEWLSSFAGQRSESGMSALNFGKARQLNHKKMVL